jgi:hypothetical protein
VPQILTKNDIDPTITTYLTHANYKQQIIKLSNLTVLYMIVYAVRQLKSNTNFQGEQLNKG